MAILLKTTSVWVSSIQIMQIRVQKRVKEFGKVDTTETYQTCAELGDFICSVLDRSEREEVRQHQPCCQTLPLSVYEGT